MFNQKETTLLQDLKHAEQLCTEKYQQYAQKAAAPNLQQLFHSIGQQEQQHLQQLQEKPLQQQQHRQQLRQQAQEVLRLKQVQPEKYSKLRQNLAQPLREAMRS